MRTSRAAVILVALIVSLAACGDDATPDESGEEQEPATVRFAPTAPLPVYWPFYYTAEPLGFYEEENLEVEFVNAQQAVQQALLAGRLDISGTGLDYYVQAHEMEEPPKWFLNADMYLWEMLTFADTGITEATDLIGKRIGIESAADSLDAEFFMAGVGVLPGEYELIPVGDDIPALRAMERGEVDAFVGAGALTRILAENNTDREIVVIDNPATDSYYNTGSMATLDTLENDRDLAVRFGRATAKGMIWQYENPEATAEMVLEVQPEAAESYEEAVEIIRGVNEDNRNSYENRGRWDLEVLQEMVDKHAELGFIDEPYDASILFTNDLIDDIWDFDVEAEIERARNDER
jgi:NitT/TauT family transport system substrate-binding protein